MVRRSRGETGGREPETRILVQRSRDRRDDGSPPLVWEQAKQDGLATQLSHFETAEKTISISRAGKASLVLVNVPTLDSSVDKSEH